MPTNYPPGRYPLQLRKRRVVSDPEDAASAITLDGPVSLFVSEQQSCTENSIVSTSTPPVARILPSSFFAQLVAEDEPQHHHHRRSKVKPRVFTDSEDTELLVVEMTEKVDLRHHFRLGGLGNKGGSGSAWRRKITPPKISVRDLVSRFWQETAPPIQKNHEEAAENQDEEAEPQEMEMPSFVSEQYSNIVTAFTNPGGGASSEEGLILWGEEEEVVEECTGSMVHFPEPETGIVTGVNENDSVSKVIPPPCPSTIC
jgi:hypothetical protein